MTTVGVKGLWTAGHTDREKDSAKHVDAHLLTYVILRQVYALSHCVVVTDSVTVRQLYGIIQSLFLSGFQVP